MPRNPTLRDIAAELNIHFTTVGKALSNDPRISEQTRQRVWAKAEEMGYRPNPLVSALMAHKKSTADKDNLSVIAVLVESKTAFRFRSVEITRESLEERARELGFKIEYFPLDRYNHDLSAIAKVLRARGIPSVMLMSISVDDVRDIARFEGFCCVSVQEHYGRIPSVMVDHFQCAELLCHRVHEAGYRRPGLIITPSLDPMGMERVVAAFRQLSASLFGQKEAPILCENEAGEKRLGAWLDHHRPDLLIESWRGVRSSDWRDSRNAGMEQWLERFRPELVHDQGHSPDRVRALLEPYPRVLLDCIEPGETGISQNRELTARKAVDVLTATLNRNDRGFPPVTHRVMIEGSWTGELPAPATPPETPKRKRRSKPPRNTGPEEAPR